MTGIEADFRATRRDRRDTFALWIAVAALVVSVVNALVPLGVLKPLGSPPDRLTASEQNDKGFDYMRARDFESAARTLEDAKAALPTKGETELRAHILYNYGRSLRCSGDAAAAVPILEERVELPFSRQIARRELRRAQQANVKSAC